MQESLGAGRVSYEVAIPKEFVEKPGQRPGDRPIVRLEDNQIILERQRYGPQAEGWMYVGAEERVLVLDTSGWIWQ